MFVDNWRGKTVVEKKNLVLTWKKARDEREGLGNGWGWKMRN